MHEDLLYQIALSKIPLVGAVNAKNLISYCGGVRQIFEASSKDLRGIPGVGIKLAANIKKQEVLKVAEQEIAFLQKYRITPLFYLSNDYPHRLKRYTDCPILLYYSGTADLNQERIVGIVGTRHPNHHGISNCEKLVEDLKEFQPLIISGLAYGIDVTAHKKCIKAEIPTVGILGHGLGRVYPSQHRKVAEMMIKLGGLLTEYTSATTPEREHFPMRNRIIAGLSDALVVVQTARKGGSMITAEIANGYHKDVFAFPGRPSDLQSKGCNYLIKSHKANLIESASDIGYMMGWDKNKCKSRQAELFIELNDREKKVVDLIRETTEIGIDQLSHAVSMNSSEIAALLLDLEFKGVVRTIPGKRYTMKGG